MVLTPTVSLAAPERVQGANCVAPSGPKDGLWKGTGIVEGWGGDEDEDVSIDSDETDSGIEALPAAAKRPQLQGVTAGRSSLQLANLSGMRENTESSDGPVSEEDLASSNERAARLNEADCHDVALGDNGSKLRRGKEQVGSFDGESVETGNIATVPKGVRFGSSSEGSALEGFAKRLDARGFRREFNVKTDGIPPRIKTVLPEAAQMGGSSRSYAKEGNKLPEEKDVSAGKTNRSSPSQSHLRTSFKGEGGHVAGDKDDKGKRTFREVSKERESVHRRSMKVHRASAGEHFNKDSSKKRRFNDLASSQAVQRKSSLRVRGQLSERTERRLERESRSERRLGRGSRGYGDAGQLPNANRARKDEDVSEVGTSVSKRGLEKVGRSPRLFLTKGGKQKPAVDNKNQRPLQAKGNLQGPSGARENFRHCQPGDGSPKTDSGEAKEAFELDSLEKVFERRPAKRKDKENETGTRDTPESKRLTRQSAASRDLSDVSGSMVKTVSQKTEEKQKENGKLADRKLTRSTDEAQGVEKAQHSGGGCDGSQNCISKQWLGAERGGFNLKRRSTRMEQECKEGADNTHVLPRTGSATAEGILTIVKDKANDLNISERDRHLVSKEFFGVELKTAAVGETEVLQAEKLTRKRRQSSEAEMDRNRKVSPGRANPLVENSKIKEDAEREGFELEQLAESKKQRLLSAGKGKSTSSLKGSNAWSPNLKQRDDIWHPRTPLSQNTKLTVPGGTQCVAMSVHPKDALPEKREDDNVLEEGEIGNSDSDTDQEAAKIAELVLPGETSEETRVGAFGNDVIHEGSKSCTLLTVRHNEPSLCRRTVQAASQIDEHGARKDFPTGSHENIRRDRVGDLQCPSADKLSRCETSELQAGEDSKVEDKSDSDDWRVSDYHNSYCQHCRQGGNLVCCDGTGCKITYHLECAEPRLLEVPVGNWYCPTCAQKRLSYGVHAVSKSVESIWDVRNRVQDSDNSTLPRKDAQANGLHGSHDEGPSVRGRSLGGAKGINAKNRNKVEDKCIAAVTVYCDDVGILEANEVTSGSQTTLRADEYDNVQKLTERMQRDPDVKMLEKSRMTLGKTIQGSTLNATHNVKPMDESRDKEYLVKWRGISHAHNTWVGEAELVKLSPKGLSRFKKKLAEGQGVPWNTDWAEPQRLVDERVTIPPRRPGGGRGRGFLGMDGQQEWFVKWKGLGYEHCTWEPVHSGVLSDPKGKQLETMFVKWNEAARQRNHPQRVAEVKKLRDENFKQLESQPEWIRFGKLLPYQLDRLNQLRQRWHHRKNTIIMDHDEQEKPLTTVTFLLSLIEEYGVYGLILVIVPVLEIQSWEAEITEHAPQVNTVVYTGGKEARGVIRRFELNRSNAPLRVQVVLTTCDVALSDFDYLRKVKWECVLIDQQFKTAKSHRALLQFDAGFWLLFISELSKYSVDELQQTLFLVHPQSSSSTPDVCKQLSVLDDSAQLQYLKDQLLEHTVRNSKPDNASGLKLVERWVGTNMTSLQVQLYCTALTKHLNLLQSGRLRSDPDSPSLHDLVTQLRLSCQHPYLAEPTLDPALRGLGKGDVPDPKLFIAAGVAASEKWQLIDAMLSVLHGHHRRVVILSQFPTQLFFFDDYLRHKYGPDSYELVDSKDSAQRKISAVHRFNTKDSTRSFFLLKTGVASGFSLKLKDSDVVIIHDSDLNPANDLEFLRKVLHRVGEIKIYRLYQRFTVEEGSMVYDQQKKLAPDTKPLSMKVLQQLLRWKVQHILKLDSSSSGHQKFDVNKKAADVLQDNFGRESAFENYVDDSWIEEDAEYVKEFWVSLLKERHAEFQEHLEQLNTGKGLRQRKRVQYSEEALALAPYSGLVEEEMRRKRKRPQLVESPSNRVSRDKEMQWSLQPLLSTASQSSSCQGKEAVQVGGLTKAEADVRLTAPEIPHIAGEQGSPGFSDGVFEQPTAEAALKTSTRPVISSVGKKVKKEVPTAHALAEVVLVKKHQNPAAAGSVSVPTSHVDSGKKLRTEQKQLLLRMKPELSLVCNILHVEESVVGYSQQLLTHVMNNYRMPKEPQELVVMVEISLCLIASANFRQAMEHLPAVSRVAGKVNLALKGEDFGSVYDRLERMCKSFVTPSLPQGATGEGPFPDEAAHVSISSQPSLAGSPPLVHTHPIPKVSEPSPSENRNSGEQQAYIDRNDLLQNRVLSGSEPDVATMAQDDLHRTELEQSEHSTPAGVCEGTGLENVDPTLRTHLNQGGPETISAAGPTLQRLGVDVSLVTLSSARTQPPLMPEEILTRLRAEKDQLLHGWLAKQKSEVQEVMATAIREKRACLKSFEKQKDKIFATSISMEQKKMLADLKEVSTSTLKLCGRDDEDRCQVMNSAQRDLRNRINALYTKLLEETTAGKLPDFLFEARSRGLIPAMSAGTPKSFEEGTTPNKDGPQRAVPRVQQSAQPSVSDQNADRRSLPGALRAQMRPPPQHQTQPQSREAPASHVPICQPIVQTKSLPQQRAQPEAQLQSQPRPPLQPLDTQQSSPVTTFSPPYSPAVPSNLGREASTPEVTSQVQSSYPPPQRSQSYRPQQSTIANERSEPHRAQSDPLPSAAGRAPIEGISGQGLEMTLAEQGIVYSRRADHTRVPESINTSTTEEPVISDMSQAFQLRASEVVQIPMSLQPMVTQALQASPSLTPRVSHSVLASPTLQPQSVQASPSLRPQSCQAVEAPTNLQPRVSQIRRPVSIQYASRHSASLYHASTTQVLVQPQVQSNGGQVYLLPSTSAVVGTMVANQARSTVHVQNLPVGALSSQSAIGPDPLAHEENRLKMEQEKLKVLYNDETIQIKTQYDREATELRKKYEGVLFERARIFEQKTAALKENLEKVDRNRQLAEALKLRSFLDHQKARHTPGHSNELISLSAPVGRLSGAPAHISGRGNLHHFQQNNLRNAGRNAGRGFAGGVSNLNSGLLAAADMGTPNSASQGVNSGLLIPPWQSLRAIHGPNDSPAGLPSGTCVSSAMTNDVPQAPGSCFVSVPEAFPHTNPSMSSPEGPFPSSFAMPPLQLTSELMQQGGMRVFLQDGSENLLAPSSNARVEQLSSYHSNSELQAAPSSLCITAAVSSPTVTEAVVVSVSPVLSPVRDQLSNLEYADNLFTHGGQSHLENGPLSADELNDLMMPENAVNSPFETRVRSVPLLETEFVEGLGAPTEIHKGLPSLPAVTVGLHHTPQTPEVPLIYLSDDDD